MLENPDQPPVQEEDPNKQEEVEEDLGIPDLKTYKEEKEKELKD